MEEVILNVIPHSTIMEFRKANLDAFIKKYGIKLGFMSVFSKACAYALQDQPVVNAVIEDGVCRLEIMFFHMIINGNILCYFFK